MKYIFRVIKKSAIFSVVLGSYCIIYAQNILPPSAKAFKPKVYVGASAGANFSKVLFSPSVSQDIKTGALAGITLRCDLEKYAGIQIEFNYSMQGWHERYDVAKGLKYSKTLHYVELPIMTQLYYEMKRVRFFINAGPKIGYRFKESVIINGSEFGEVDKLRHDLHTVQPVEWGLCGGPGVSIRLGDKSLLEVEGRFFYAFGDVFRTKRVDPYGQASEQVISGKINYLFRF
ncbi:porin family protein [Porphyromonas pogonae]|uniref:porin family protein n=1 Tax=Porphyromonas pogonae TaxID=867595 RepID=UPI002E78AF0D|nr:porin family protein [Porphyromonas pogonae]